jgi:hypothetical protein
MLETDTQAPLETPAEPESRNWTSLIVGLVVAVLVVGAGALVWWLASSDDADDGTAVATELVETWSQGWNENDPELVRSVFTEDGVYIDRGERIDAEVIATHARFHGPLITNGERIGELTSIGDETYTWVHEFDAGGNRYSAVGEIELEGDLATRIEWMGNDFEVIGTASGS